MGISELTLVAPDKEKRDSIPQNERSYAGIRCRGIEERQIQTPICDVQNNREMVAKRQINR